MNAFIGSENYSRKASTFSAAFLGAATYLLLGVSLCFPLQAQADDKPEGPKETVKTGVIATNTRTKDFAAIDVQTSGAAPGDDVSVISGSVLRPKRGQCVGKVINNGNKTYSVGFSVVGVNNEGRKEMERFFSATLKPKASAERLVTSCDDGLNVSVVLKSARALD